MLDPGTSIRKRNGILFVAYRMSVHKAALEQWRIDIEDIVPESFITYEPSYIVCHGGTSSNHRHILWVPRSKLKEIWQALHPPPIEEASPTPSPQSSNPITDFALGLLVDKLIEGYLAANNVSDPLPLWERPKPKPKPVPLKTVRGHEGLDGVRRIVLEDGPYYEVHYVARGMKHRTVISILEHGDKGALQEARRILGIR